MTSENEILFRHEDPLEKMPIPERERIMGEKLHRLARHAYKNAPAVKERFDKADINPENVHCIKDLEKLPVLRKDELIQLQKSSPPFGGYLAVPIEKLERVFQSPGPINDPERKIWAGTDLTSFGKGQIVMNTWSYHISPGGFMVDQMLRNMGCTVFPAGPGNTDLQLEIMQNLRVSGFVGTPSFLYAIIQKAEKRGLDFKKDFNLKWAMVFGEMGGASLREMFKEKYGIYCLGGDAYATADIGFMAFSCDRNVGMHVSTDVIVEIVNPNTGEVLGPNEVGEVVVTPFDEVYPLIRFGTGDLSTLIIEPCECGRTTPRLPKIMGRSGDAVRVRGMFVHPNQTNEVVSKFPEIASYQLVVTRAQNRDEMTMLIELNYQHLADKDKWLEDLDKSFRDVCKVKFDNLSFVTKGTVPVGAARIIDKRIY
ncbi:MAG: AMP-binding protein [Deltaproteobacteria bacterium]|nr:AMP-binding protein [Deltaproteobacteria bacterium]